jgi:hypothetical protein
VAQFDPAAAGQEHAEHDDIGVVRNPRRDLVAGPVAVARDGDDVPNGRGACPDPAAAAALRAETLAVVISAVLTSGSRSGPRWLMALAACNAAEMLGAFDAGIE